MKLVVAFIKPHRLGDLSLALHKVEGLTGMTVCDVKGFGRTRGKGAPDRIIDDVADFVRKVRIDIFCTDAIVEDVIETIREQAHTGLHGDGKIYVLNVHDALRISTGERGETAI